MSGVDTTDIALAVAVIFAPLAVVLLFAVIRGYDIDLHMHRNDDDQPPRRRRRLRRDARDDDDGAGA